MGWSDEALEQAYRDNPDLRRDVPPQSKISRGAEAPKPFYTKASGWTAEGIAEQERRKADAPKRGMNKWEALYAEKLGAYQNTGIILWWKFEGMRFRLADGAYYKPDFVALAHTGELMVYEVKGHWREAARLRIKVAADQHPFRFMVVRRRLVKEGGGWAEECFTAALDRLKTERA